MRKPSSHEAKELVASILKYFDWYLQYAKLENDRRLVWHFEDCWRLVFTQFYGGCSVPYHHKVELHIVQGTAAPAAKPQWFIDKYSRPARKVMLQVREQVRMGRKRAGFSVTYDVLTCGHKVEAKHKENGSNTSKWRYCNECEPKQKQTASAGRLDGAAA